MQERGQEVRVVYLNWQLDKEVLVSKARLLQTDKALALPGVCIKQRSHLDTHASVVNLFSLEEKADMSCGDSRKARRLKDP